MFLPTLDFREAIGQRFCWDHNLLASCSDSSSLRAGRLPGFFVPGQSGPGLLMGGAWPSGHCSSYGLWVNWHIRFHLDRHGSLLLTLHWQVSHPGPVSGGWCVCVCICPIMATRKAVCLALLFHTKLSLQLVHLVAALLEIPSFIPR